MHPRTLRRMAKATFALSIGLMGLALSPHALNAQTGPIPGVAYGMPRGTESYAAGTLVSYGGYEYIAQGDGTMMLAASRGQRPLPPVRQQTATRVITTVPATTTVVRTVTPAWGYTNWGFGGPVPVYGPVVRPYGWGPWIGPRPWGPYGGPMRPPFAGPYRGFW